MVSKMAMSKVMNGSNFAGVLKYVSEKEDAELITKSGVFKVDAKLIATEMSANAAQRNLKKPVMHIALSLPHGERATSEQWQTAAEVYLKEMGFDLDKSQFAVYRHNDKDHDHIHIVANRVQLDGKVVSDSKQYDRSHAATRVAERAAGLSLYEDAVKKEKGHLHNLRSAIDQSLKAGTSLARFRANLAERGIQIQENRSKTTNRLSGLSFKDADGRVWKGSSLGKDYSLNGLEKRGLETGRDAQSQGSQHQGKAQVHSDKGKVSVRTQSAEAVGSATQAKVDAKRAKDDAYLNKTKSDDQKRNSDAKAAERLHDREDELELEL